MKISVSNTYGSVGLAKVKVSGIKVQIASSMSVIGLVKNGLILATFLKNLKLHPGY